MPGIHKPNPPMTEEQILVMYNAGWEVGSHSMNHLDLTKLEPDAMRYEIVESRAFLEDELGVPESESLGAGNPGIPGHTGDHHHPAFNHHGGTGSPTVRNDPQPATGAYF